jgi:hypothetical protein
MTDIKAQSDSTKPCQPYKYTPLKKDIRLLVLFPSKDNEQISSKIKHVSIKDKPRYTALSYAWGDPARTEEIFVYGRAFHVTTNLFSFLFHLRQNLTSAISLWRDAIYIDQENPVEKAQQIRLMRSIYQQAGDVMIWLGKSADDSDLVLSMPRMSKQEVENSTQTVSREQMDRVSKGIGCFYERSWWTRLWIVQEVAVAKVCPMIGAGNSWISWASIEREKKEFIDNDNSGGVMSTTSRSGPLIYSSLVEVRQTFQKEGSLLLSELLLSFVHRHTSVSHDRIYALLGLARDTQDFPVDYNMTIDQLYAETARTCIRTSGNLNILLYVERATPYAWKDQTWDDTIWRSALNSYGEGQGWSPIPEDLEYRSPDALPT